MSTYLIYTENDPHPIHHQLDKVNASPEEILESLELAGWYKPVRIENVVLGLVYRYTSNGWVRIVEPYVPIPGEDRLLSE